MMIRVMYHDGKTEMVRQPLLRHLMKTANIQKSFTMAADDDLDDLDELDELGVKP